MTWPSCVKTNTADNPDNTTRPKELILDIHLPLLDSAAGVDLDVQERSLVLERAEPPRYELRLPLPYPVDEASGSAKFDKGTRRLTVSLPIKAAMMAVPKTERLSSNDSGIDLAESDDSYRTTMVNDGAAERENSNSGGDDDETLDINLQMMNMTMMTMTTINDDDNDQLSMMMTLSNNDDDDQ